MTQQELESQYRERHESILNPIAESLESLLRSHFTGCDRIDRISARAKSVDRFVAKSMKEVEGKRKYNDPLREIQDQVGARIITFYLTDVPRVAETVLRYFNPIEERDVIPDSEREFDYTGKHFILFLPTDVIRDEWTAAMHPGVFELQIKTLFQHAWSEANHDLGYKPNAPLTRDQKRRIAFTSAQSWGADHIFDELHKETTVAPAVVASAE